MNLPGEGGVLRRRLPSILLGLLAASVLAASPASADETDEIGKEFLQALKGETPLRDKIADLQATLKAIRKNLKKQKVAWPTRKEDQANEAAPPSKVVRLQETRRQLEEKKGKLIDEIAKRARKDFNPVLKSLRATKSRSLVEALVPIAVKVGRKDPGTTSVLLELADRFDPCPASVIDALAKVPSKKARSTLLKMGKKEKDVRTLIAAAKSGDPAIVKQLINLAEGSDKKLAADCLRALARLTPSTRLESLVAARIQSVESVELKITLIVYLGLCKSLSNFPLFQQLYKTERNEKIRLAAIGAMSGLGFEGSRYIFSQLKKDGNSLAIRKGCVQALGGVRYRRAIPLFLELLNDPALKPDAVRSLERISGKKLGQQPAVWLQWWKSQPEAEKEPDPDE